MQIKVKHNRGLDSVAIVGGGVSYNTHFELMRLGAVYRGKCDRCADPMISGTHYEFSLPIANRLIEETEYRIAETREFGNGDRDDIVRTKPPEFMRNWRSAVMTDEFYELLDNEVIPKEVMERLNEYRRFGIDEEAIKLIERWKEFENTFKRIKANDLEVIDSILFRNGIDDKWFSRSPLLHQKAGIAFFLLSLEYGMGHICLFDEMRTGKTYQAIHIARYLLERKLIDSVLVVVPNTIKRVWRQELMIDGGLYGMFVSIIEGDKARKRELWNSKAFFYIVNYECCRSDKELLYNWERGRRYLMICDESHKIKNPQAQQTQVICGLEPNYSIFMTGTPVANRPEDVFCMVDFVCSGLLGRDLYDFYERFAVRGGYGGKEILGYKDMPEIRYRLGNISMRRKRADVMFDTKVRTAFEGELEGDQRTAYETMRTELYAEVVKESNMTVVSVNNRLVQSLRLSQICDGYISPSFDKVVWLENNWKLRVIDEFLDEYLADIGKVVIWSRFVPVVKLVWERYRDKYGALYITGEVNTNDRVERMYAFQNDMSHKIMVGQIQSASLGMGFQPATFAIFIDKWWSPSLNLQAEDRILGIKNPVPITIISLITKDTIEERWEYILNKKRDWSDAITGDVQVDIVAPPKFDRDILLYLLAPPREAEEFRKKLEDKWKI